MRLVKERKLRVSIGLICGSQTIRAWGGVRQQSKTAADKKIACLGVPGRLFYSERIEIYGLHHILAAKFAVSESYWMI